MYKNTYRIGKLKEHRNTWRKAFRTTIYPLRDVDGWERFGKKLSAVGLMKVSSDVALKSIS